MPLLIAEDDPKISKLLRYMFTADGYTVDCAEDGEEALLYCEANQYDVVILDWMMPNKSGIEVLRTLRQRGYNGAILMLTAKDTLDNKIDGLDSGADDYLSKPFEYRELLSRIKALQRRSTQRLVEERLFIGPFSLDKQQMQIYVGTTNLELSHREYQLFSLLLENNGNTVVRGTIIDRVWGLDQSVSPNNLDAYIKLLRKKIALHHPSPVIQSVRGIGYKVDLQ